MTHNILLCATLLNRCTPEYLISNIPFTSINHFSRMNPSSVFIHRRLLQVAEAASSPPTSSATTLPSNSSYKPFDFTTTLAVIVLFAVLFVLGLLSATISRYISGHVESYVSSGYRSSAEDGEVGDSGNSLPLVAYGKAGKRQMAIDECAICLSKFDEKETVKMIPYCGHVFHPGCIDTWMERHVTCPLCRSGQLFRSREEELRLDVMGER